MFNSKSFLVNSIKDDIFKTELCKDYNLLEKRKYNESKKNQKEFEKNLYLNN